VVITKAGKSLPNTFFEIMAGKKPMRPPEEEERILSQVREDVRAIQQDRKRKMSEITLRYLKEKRIIGGDKVGMYLSVTRDPEERKTISEKGIIELVNNKLLDAYSTV